MRGIGNPFSFSTRRSRASFAMMLLVVCLGSAFAASLFSPGWTVLSGAPPDDTALFLVWLNLAGILGVIAADITVFLAFMAGRLLDMGQKRIYLLALVPIIVINGFTGGLPMLAVMIAFCLIPGRPTAETGATIAP